MQKKVPKHWIRSKIDLKAIEEGCYFDQSAADHVCDFFETFLCHSKGEWAGKPFVLEGWQRDYLSRLYGWKRPDNTRRYRESYLEIPKKNGKSTLLSGICLYALFEEAGAEVYVGAVDRSQASIIFDEASRMVESSPALSRHLTIVRSQKRIVFARNNAKLVAMSADAPSKDGVSSSTCVLDETHRFKTKDIYDIMKYSGAARRQPLLVNITTAGFDRHSLCYQLHDYSINVNQATIADTSFLGVIYCADLETDDIDSPITWRKANPSMGSILKEDEFKRSLIEARQTPSLYNNFLRLRLNVWTAIETRWLPVDKWDELEEAIEPSSLHGETCFVALDLSSTTDLTALCLVFPQEDGTYKVLPYFFVPKDTVEVRARKDKVSYPQWIKDDHIIETQGNVTDYDAIRKKISDLSDVYRFEKVGIDPWNAQQLCNQLETDGQDVVEYRQNYANLSPPSKELERLILSKKIRQNGNPCLRWNVGNCAVEQDASGNIRPSKKRSNERIDGCVALVMALGLATKTKPVGEASFSFV